ncbi:NRDE family protein [Tessaracoccus sp. MC1627]|uniref:NRDE family protein n=1 Tax=Tessaracoccus sp. MC1627 TaxID=2760312 RepID=UPI001601DF8B|nr:NRDE family protein [Tessaracoccus sp. MC1627]MBB1512490.1 NRDE family protein [Tessaracoccus sp. MC1627]
MCTVVIRVPEPGEGPVRVLAVRDEDPERPWLPWGAWWPDRPSVRGVRDELAGGAWLAADGSRLAVLLNRAGGADVPVPTSRGSLVLDAVAGRPLPEPLTTLGFNLVEAHAEGARVTSWEGGRPSVTDLAPGTHMVAHEDVDDPTTPRIAQWLGRFATTATDDRGDGRWWEAWLRVLEESARLEAADDRAIIRDNRPHGYPTLSLLVAVASLDASGIRVATDALARPGQWNRPRL